MRPLPRFPCSARHAATRAFCQVNFIPVCRFSELHWTQQRVNLLRVVFIISIAKKLNVLASIYICLWFGTCYIEQENFINEIKMDTDYNKYM